MVYWAIGLLAENLLDGLHYYGKGVWDNGMAWFETREYRIIT